MIKELSTTPALIAPGVVKDGWKTSEFWLTLIAQVVVILVLFGFIPKGEQQTVQDALSLAVTNVAALVTSFITLWKYLQSRTQVKASAATANASIEVRNAATVAGG